MAGLKAAIVALALTTASGFAPQTGGAAARERQRARPVLGAFILSIPTAARHHLCVCNLAPRGARRALHRRVALHAVDAPPCLDARVAARRRRAVDATWRGRRRHRRDAIAATPPTRRHAGQVALHGYVPSGMSPEAYAAMKKKEEADRKKKQFGKGGARGFESRRLAAF